MESKEVQKNTMKSLRNALMDTIYDIRNGKMEHKEGLAVAKLGNTMVQSYRADIEAVKTANELKEPNRAYGKALDLEVITVKALN